MPGLAKGDLFDGVHPTAAGHAKIAAAFYGALEEGFASGDFGGPRTSTAGVCDLTGSERGDFLGGDASGNRIEGGAGADVLRGRRGADALKGGLDDDTLRGGRGRDVFVFDDRDGGDVIRDFQNRKDKIQIEGGAAGFDELAMTEIDGDAHVAFARTEITLRDVDIADLGPGDFLFV
jgi:Ca2+-binding RTX toxin-like protein